MVPRAAEDYGHYYGRRGDGGGPPHGLLLLGVVLALAIAGPRVLGEGAGEAITEAVAEMLSPVGLLLLPVSLIFVIRLLSDDRSAAVLANAFAFCGAPDAVHRVGGSPVGVVIVLFLVLVMVYYKSPSLFGGGDEGDGE
ncbi:hypothetical protein E2562_020436 [Oryza meyeriana var. granulata]|uniref:Uncharacterized protein n=1 Tax=Oryza meyeriana var. granulata TaxID=110450 RepID=A0A6G1D5H2_9ORYZ|nr:hypothetical protein E2562_020436 [Oryza meyeriana var. granulata]